MKKIFRRDKAVEKREDNLTVAAEEACATKLLPAADIDYDKVLELALDIGVGLLASGGSVSRVETAVDRICMAYGAEEANVAAFPSMIIASVRDNDGHAYSYTKRVYSTSNNLALLERYNQLSRDVCKNRYPLDEALKMSYGIAHNNPRNKWITVVGASLVAGIYSIFFGGTIADVLPALVVAFGMAFLNEVLSKRSLNVYATTFILSLLGGILSICFCKLLNMIGLPCQLSYVIIGTIMILIPGLSTTNAVRDMFTGDLMSGTFTLLNGILLTVVIAAGYGLSMLALQPITGFVSLTPYTGWVKAGALLASGTLGAVAVCLFFNLNLKRLGWAILASFLTLLIFIGMLMAFDYNNDYIFIIVLVPTFFAAVLSETMARFIKIPATVILVPAIIALVPGSSLYYAMEAIVQGDTVSAGSWAVTCLLTLLALAVGICAATILFRLISPVKLKYYKKNKRAFMRKKAKYGDGEELPAETSGKRKFREIFSKSKTDKKSRKGKRGAMDVNEETTVVVQDEERDTDGKSEEV